MSCSPLGVLLFALLLLGTGMRFLLAALLCLGLVGCGGGEDKPETADVVGTIEVSKPKAIDARCVLLHAAHKTYHLTPGAYTLLPIPTKNGVNPKVVRASRLSKAGSMTALLRHGAQVTVSGNVRSVPKGDPCDADQILSVEKVSTAATS